MIDADTIQSYIDRIDAGKSIDLPDVQGYSSRKVRELLNLLVTNIAAHYLEIGVHLGSTFIPAIYGSDTPATCIDNWSRFGNLRDQFEANLALHKLLTDRVQIIEQDCWTVDLGKITAHGGLVNVYFFDGEHSAEDQYKAVDYYLPILADKFVLIVDDANWSEPRNETYRALKDNHVTIVKDWLLPGPYNGGPDEWWNGLLVLICHK